MYAIIDGQRKFAVDAALRTSDDRGQASYVYTPTFASFPSPGKVRLYDLRG